jgi:hypothetical protein
MYGPVEHESARAGFAAVRDSDRYVVHIGISAGSMTSKNCNDLLCMFRNMGGFDYFAMLHADVAAEDGWLQTMIERMEAFGLDVIHAPCALKNEKGYTTTCVSYDDNPWHPNRRITTTELQQLPETFDIDTLKECYDSDATRMVINTGCMVVKNGPWFEKFPAFTMWDHIVKHNGDWFACSVSEDYVFGHWLADNGIRTGATKVATRHYGRGEYATSKVWGFDRDMEFDVAVEELKGWNVATVPA